MLTLENPDQCRQLSHGLCMCVCVIIGRICLFGLLDKPRTSAYVHACKQHRDSWSFGTAAPSAPPYVHAGCRSHPEPRCDQVDLTRGDLTSQGDAHDHLTSSFLLPMITNTNDDYLFILFVCLLFICSLLFVVICLLFVYCSLVRWTCKFVSRFYDFLFFFRDFLK